MKMPWGKYKGEEVEDLPTDYIQWLLTNTSPVPSLESELQAQLDAREGRGINRGRERRGE